jgi:uncharacterized protein YybS (DUF2232 family)
MLALARYALKSPYHAATIVGLLAVLSLFVPLVSILSGAVVGLIILTQGLIPGTRALLISLVGITVVSYLVTQSPMLGITIGLVQWIPMVLLAEVLRRSRSLSITLVIGMLAALVVVAAQYLLWPDIDKMWAGYLQQMFAGAEQQAGLDGDQLQQAIAQLVHMMTLVLVAVMYSTFIGTLLAARWFQARLTESEGFRDEFHALKLGKGAALATLLVIAASFIVSQDWLYAMLMVMLMTFLYQGLAVVHRWSRDKRQKGWLVLLYILMVIFPQVLAAMAVLGIIDNWIDFRSKLKSAKIED